MPYIILFVNIFLMPCRIIRQGRYFSGVHHRLKAGILPYWAQPAP